MIALSLCILYLFIGRFYSRDIISSQSKSKLLISFSILYRYCIDASPCRSDSLAKQSLSRGGALLALRTLSGDRLRIEGSTAEARVWEHRAKEWSWQACRIF